MTCRTSVFTKTRKISTGIFVVCALLAACAGGLRIAPRTSAHDTYAAMLRSSGLDKTALGQQWQAAADQALRSAAPITSPFSETGYFPADEPMAVAYRLDLQRGRRLAIEVKFESSDAGRLFVDLFRSEPAGDVRLVASLDEEASVLEYEVERTATFVLRIQPELLRSGRFTLSERTLAALRTFPISGMSHREIQSEFGAERDRGTRTHEGVDIFAAHGTPVVAVADGTARPDTNGLGGNVVWLRSGLLGATYYYAHLDSWAIEGSTRVHEGDVLGYVGNTGNARTTSPHLHFGVYERGAIDPAPFLEPDERDAPLSPDEGRLAMLVRTRNARTPLREGPSSSAAERVTLEQNTVARRLGITGPWHRVRLPDRSVGYVAATALVSADTPLRKRRAARDIELREQPDADAPVIETVTANEETDLIGRFGTFDLLRPAAGRPGWVTNE